MPEENLIRSGSVLEAVVGNLLKGGLGGTVAKSLKGSLEKKLFEKLLDPITDAWESSRLNEYEKEMEEADNLKRLAERVQRIQNSDSSREKFIDSAFLTLDTISGSINSFLGGTDPSFVDYSKAIWYPQFYGKDAKAILDKEFDWQKKLADAKLKQWETEQEELKNNPALDLNGDGSRNDSLPDVQAKRAGAEAENKLIASAISQLRDLLKQYSEGDSRRNEILLRIKELEKDSVDNLVKIYTSATSGKSTFNLPSDIRPITYWEAQTSKNTHQNMTVRSGDVIINLTVDKMSGDRKDINKVTAAISKTARDMQADLTRLLSRQVISGMGNVYRAY